MINFNEIQEKAMSNFKGGDGETIARLFSNDDIKIMKAVLPEGSSIGMHTHETSCEVIYIISGEARCILEGKEEIIKEGECHYCPKGATHTTINNSDKDLVMLCVVPEVV